MSMMKVAQGWVLNWWPPQRLAPEPSQLERVQAPATPTLLPALSQVTGEPEEPAGQRPAAYTIELREKGAAWQTLATSRDSSLLIKDLKPGSEYMFRVFALSASGARGTPTPDFRYLIPDNRRKPGSTQALSAGVVSGILFFIACIVIAVCAVNMCNKRRKKRAEKGKRTAISISIWRPTLQFHDLQ